MMTKFQKMLMGMTLLASINTYADESISTSLYRVVAPDMSAGFYEYEVLSIEDRTTYYLSANESALLATAEEALATDRKVQLTFDEKRNISAISLLDVEAITLADVDVEEMSGMDKRLGAEQFGYTPTNYQSASEVNTLFSSLSRLSDKSQCYQRAHVWAKTLWDRFDTKSMKVFIFFTSRYKRAYNYKWWFHVAPYVHLNGEPRVLDYQFTNSPLNMKDWSDEFMHNKATCPKMENYSDYDRYARSEDCLLAYVPMYFYQPSDIEGYERNGSHKANWSNFDIKHSRRALKCPWIGRCF
jgi:hypothetical protein